MSTEKKTEFQVGDVVDWCGLEGVVTEIGGDTSVGFPVGVTFINETYEEFTLDGRFYHDHTKSSLELKSRPKKTRTIKLWTFTMQQKNCLSRLCDSQDFYETAEQAEKHWENVHGAPWIARKNLYSQREVIIEE